MRYRNQHADLYMPGFHPISFIRTFRAASRAARTQVTAEAFAKAAVEAGCKVTINGKELN